MGYALAGFDEIVGVDIYPMPNYPFDLIEGEHAVEFVQEYGREFDVIHASPPCQRFSKMSQCRAGLSEKYPDYIRQLRSIFSTLDVPYVLENVVGAPLLQPITLCGTMFGLRLYRHRLFESNIPISAPKHPIHTIPASKAGHWKPGTIISVAGHVSPMAEAREAMGIDWMTRDELVEAIPPCYTEHIGKQLLERLV